MKKLLPILLISIFLFSCKSNEEPKPTLADRAGTYEGGGYTVIVSSIGEIQVIQNSLQVGFAKFDADSRAEDFNVGTYKVELDNDPEINDTPLSKINNTGTIRLTLEQRVGVYKLVEGTKEYVVEVKSTGAIWLSWGNSPIIPLVTTPIFQTIRIDTIFNVVEPTYTAKSYKIMFLSETQLTMSEGLLQPGVVKTLTKQ